MVEDEKWQKKIDDSKDEIKDGLDKLKSVFSPIGDLSLGGGGSLYCPPAVTVLGKSISFCLDKYSGSLDWIAQAVLFMCAVIALFIVFA
ncbi:hypothetical protein [Pseudomonas cerasi]|uniref:hypothetical protein n=1 Tax=Pseudomonas cerasi TaxID=1583341 RepID=UPI000CF12799|nr:hypothetical protein [Pseudomonas cerasi]